jgi:nitrous oxide reductase accessory protein NosL
MAISETRYAAELIRQDGEPIKFDDIGCMIHYVEGTRQNDDVAACFVLDFDSQEWLDADRAFFLRSPAFKTPMGGGIVAFKEKSNADAAVTKYGGKLLGFADLSREITRSSKGRVFANVGVFASSGQAHDRENDKAITSRGVSDRGVMKWTSTRLLQLRARN